MIVYIKIILWILFRFMVGLDFWVRVRFRKVGVGLSVGCFWDWGIEDVRLR